MAFVITSPSRVFRARFTSALPPCRSTDLARTGDHWGIDHFPLKRENRTAAGLPPGQHLGGPCYFRFGRGQCAADNRQLRRMNGGNGPHPKITPSANLAGVKLQIAEVGD